MQTMLDVLDRHLKAWHIVAADALALAWFVGITLLSQTGVPNVALFRCPVGFCAGGYTREELRATLEEIGPEGRDFLYGTLLQLDLVLPALLLIALLATTLWFSRPGQAFAVALHPGARYALLAVPVLYCLADYGENAAVAEMLRAYPTIDEALAQKASFLTALKSQLVAASVGIVVALAVAAWGSRSRAGRNPPRGLL